MPPGPAAAGPLDPMIVASLHDLGRASEAGTAGIRDLVTTFLDDSGSRFADLRVAVRDGDEHTRISTVVDAEGWERAKSRPEVRSLLQRFGTQVGRMILGENVWVDTALRDLSKRTVFTDVRFPNEADAIRSRHGIVIRVERSGVGPVNSHPSETGLDHYSFDVVIQNDGTIEEFHASINDAVGQWMDRSAFLDGS